LGLFLVNILVIVIPTLKNGCKKCFLKIKNSKKCIEAKAKCIDCCKKEEIVVKPKRKKLKWNPPPVPEPSASEYGSEWESSVVESVIPSIRQHPLPILDKDGKVLGAIYKKPKTSEEIERDRIKSDLRKEFPSMFSEVKEEEEDFPDGPECYKGIDY
jgi:hypothetical protein